jgi:hypothetical protein
MRIQIASAVVLAVAALGCGGTDAGATTYFYSIDGKTLSLATVFRGQISTFQKQ